MRECWFLKRFPIARFERGVRDVAHVHSAAIGGERASVRIRRCVLTNLPRHWVEYRNFIAVIFINELSSGGPYASVGVEGHWRSSCLIPSRRVEYSQTNVARRRRPYSKCYLISAVAMKLCPKWSIVCVQIIDGPLNLYARGVDRDTRGIRRGYGELTFQRFAHVRRFRRHAHRHVPRGGDVWKLFTHVHG